MAAPGATPHAPRLMLSATVAAVSTMENSLQKAPQSTASSVWPALWGATASAMLQGGATGCKEHRMSKFSVEQC